MSPLLFNLVIEEATKHCRRGVPWDMLYADDVVLTAKSRAEVEEQFERWKSAMESKGLKVNIEKTKILVTGKECETVVSSGEYPCGVCGRGVGVNSVLCVECDRWIHKRCSGLQRVSQAYDLVCPACIRRRQAGNANAPTDDIVVGPAENDVVEEVEVMLMHRLTT